MVYPKREAKENICGFLTLYLCFSQRFDAMQESWSNENPELKSKLSTNLKLVPTSVFRRVRTD